MEILCAILTIAVYIWLCKLSENHFQSQEHFGDGKNMYDFKDYVNNKVDKDMK